MNRQKLILFCLMVALALALVWSYFRIPRQQTVSARKYTIGQRPPASAAGPARSAATTRIEPRSAGGVRLDLLDREMPEFRGYRRNIFRPVFVDQVKQAKLRAAAIKARPLPRPPPPPPPPPIKPAVDEKPRAELAKFTFLGFLQKDKRKIIFLSKDKEIILVRKGDIFAGRYEAASITDQALTIKVTDTGEEIIIPLVEYAALRAAR